MTASVLAMMALATSAYAGREDDDDDDRGPRGEQGIQGEQGPIGPQGPKGDTGPIGATGPQGDTGPKGDTGPAGQDGADGRDGVSFDYDRYLNDLSSTTALGGIELRTPTKGVWTYGVGIGGVVSEGDSAEAVSAGIRYGITEYSSVYGKISRSLKGNSTAWYVGFEGQF